MMTKQNKVQNHSVLSSIHLLTYTYAHTHAHTHTHTRTHAHTHTMMKTYTNEHTHTSMQAHPPTHKHFHLAQPLSNVQSHVSDHEASNLKTSVGTVHSNMNYIDKA